MALEITEELDNYSLQESTFYDTFSGDKRMSANNFPKPVKQKKTVTFLPIYPSKVSLVGGREKVNLIE